MRTRQPTVDLLSRALSTALGIVLALTTLAACSGSGSGSADAKTVLTKARSVLDGTKSVHFTLQSAQVPTGSFRLIGGDGVAARPNSFQGKLSVMVNGGTVSIELVSLGGQVYAKLPFANDFQVTNPSDFGLRDPATLIDPKTGIAQIFDQLTDVTSKGERRIGSDVTQQIDGKIPGQLVADLLTSADPAKPVTASLYFTKDTNELRQAVLTGPFYDQGKDSTFTLVLTKYGDNPPITLPEGVNSAAPTT